MQLTSENYYSQEANKEYMSVSGYKDFAGTYGKMPCEFYGMEKLNGRWEDEKSTALLVGSYVDSYFEGNAIAEAMLQGCRNNNIGYCQGHRSNVIEQLRKAGKLAKISAKTEADCSSLVRACCIQAGFDPGNFNTASEVSALKATGQFMEPIAVTSKTELFNGDVLVTKTKGHTVVVVSGNPRRGNAYYPKYEGASGSIITALAAVGEKDTSKAHRAKIAAANGITNYAYTAAQNTKMVNLLKKGKLIKA